MSALPLLVQAFRQPQQLARFTLLEWDLVLRQAAVANLTAGLCHLAEEAGLLGRIAPQAGEHLAWARTVGERHGQAVRFEVGEIRRALAGLGVRLILLKGAAYTLASLPPAPGRLFSDIDILVPRERLAEVEAALMLHGWAASGHDAYDQRYYREWMHELPPMQHVKRQSMIDVHHAILPETAAAHPEPALLRASAVPVAGQDDLRVLAPLDMLLHSAVHLFYDGEFDHGLRDLVDIDRLLGEFGKLPGFWDALPLRARALQLERPLFYALRYAQKMLATAIPAQAMRVGRPCWPLLALMDQLFGRALLPIHASCADRFSAGARFALYVRGNWLRMPPLLLVRHLLYKAFMSPRRAPVSQ